MQSQKICPETVCIEVLLMVRMGRRGEGAHDVQRPVVVTRSDVAFAVNPCAHFMSNRGQFMLLLSSAYYGTLRGQRR